MFKNCFFASTLQNPTHNSTSAPNHYGHSTIAAALHTLILFTTVFQVTGELRYISIFEWPIVLCSIFVLYPAILNGNLTLYPNPYPTIFSVASHHNLLCPMARTTSPSPFPFSFHHSVMNIFENHCQIPYPFIKLWWHRPIWNYKFMVLIVPNDYSLL